MMEILAALWKDKGGQATRYAQAASLLEKNGTFGGLGKGPGIETSE
jgi:hypothetical protein